MSEQAVDAFYDALAASYDEMTSFDKRFAKESPPFQQLVERFGIRNALDAGCGSGFHSVLLARLGVRVTGLDVSPAMVRLAEANAVKYGVTVKALVGTFSEAATLLDERFDAVFVMGNSLPHLLTLEDLRNALRVLSGVLKSRGLLFLQCLNYDRILARKEHVQSTRNSGEKTFVRQYEYDEDQILFSIVTQFNSSGGREETRQSVRLRPILRDEMGLVLQQAGFVQNEFFGTISLDPFDPALSPDLIALARTPDLSISAPPGR